MPSKADAAFLRRLGITDPVQQEIVMEALPCGISSVSEAWKDGTSWQTNAPRAILVCYWKGMVEGFIRLAQRREASHE